MAAPVDTAVSRSPAAVDGLDASAVGAEPSGRTSVSPSAEKPDVDVDAGDQPPADGAGIEFKPGLRFYLAFVTLSTITLAAALDATSLSVALPIISDKLGGTAIEAFWSGTSFLLTSTVFQPSFASMSHIFGRKPILYVALAFFAVGALLAGITNTFTLMLVGRSLQGVGGGGIIALSEIIVTDLVPLRVRGVWFGYLSSMWAVGSVSGPVIGGAFAQNVSWRWIFYINLPIIGLALVFVTVFLKLNFVAGSFREKLGRFDWIGAALFISSTTSVLIPITWGGVSYPWDSWHTLVPLLLGVAGLTGFVLYERYFAIEPMMPFSIFANRDLQITYFTTFLHGMILWSLLYYMPLYFEAVKGYSPIITGVALFPETFTVAPASIVVGIILTVTGDYKWSLWVGWTLTTIGIGLLNLMTPDISVAGWIFVNLVGGLGLGILFPTMGASVQAAMDVKDIAFGVAFYSFFRAFGQGIGIAVGGVIFQNQIRTKILGYPLIADMADAYSQDATSLVRVIASMEDGDAKAQLIQAFADALKTIWIVMCVLAGIAGISSLFIRGYSLDQTHVTAQGFDYGRDAETDVEKS